MTTIQIFKSNLNGRKPTREAINGAVKYTAHNGASLTIKRDSYPQYMRESLGLPLNRRVFILDYSAA